MKKVVHFSSVHQRYDIRIFLKECVTLSENGYEVIFVVADGRGDEVKQGIKIVDVGKPTAGRLSRMFSSTKEIYSALSVIEADIYHFHDPELIPIGIKLKKRYPNSKIIFDSHENYADDIQDKSYIPKFLRALISKIYRIYERYAVRRLDAVVAATPSICKHFSQIGVLSLDINNYPFLNEFLKTSSDDEKIFDAVYIGAISKIRGVKPLVDALAIYPERKLVMAGTIMEGFDNELRESLGWKNVEFLGQVDRNEVQNVLSSAKMAVVTFLPAANHNESQPNKMFEYMSAGLPVIASDFPLWKEIIEGNGCGLCVNPNSPEQISDAIEKISINAEQANLMGQNGRKAILEKYNWQKESEKLLNFYIKILGE